MKASMPLVAIFTLFLVGCGPSASGTDADTSGGGPDAVGGCVISENVESSCFDNQDNDCDGLRDCNDSDCATACAPPADAAECAETIFLGPAVAIPDNLGIPYSSTLSISGFDPGQTLLDVNGILSVCVTMEHTWLRDLKIELECPSGTILSMQSFLGRMGGEIFMGVPIDNDGVNPTPGTGWAYCWTPTAVNGPSMVEWAANNAAHTLPAGDYQTSDPYTNLVGCGLNGNWTIRVVDDWASDNGFMFGWSITFAPEIIPECLIIVVP